MKTKLAYIVIRQTETSDDLEKLYRFRYQVYVEEMQRPQRYADHDHKRIEEPLDATATHFIAMEGEEIVGCLRWNCGLDTDFGEYVELYDMHKAGPYFPTRCSITTKLMTAPQYRRSTLGIDLSVACFTQGIERGVVCDFIDCNPHLERFFTRFGYRTYRGRIDHPEYGDVLPMMLLCPDLEHLSRLRSPFAKAAHDGARHPESVHYFHLHVFNEKPQIEHATSSH